jgi:hypothetical protein
MFLTQDMYMQKNDICHLANVTTPCDVYFGSGMHDKFGPFGLVGVNLLGPVNGYIVFIGTPIRDGHTHIQHATAGDGYLDPKAKYGPDVPPVGRTDGECDLTSVHVSISCSFLYDNRPAYLTVEMH